jgi:hypothetical protein
MKLTQKAIDKLKSDREYRLKLAYVLQFTEVWIDRMIAKNKENGTLTTVKALSVIKDITGMAFEEILEEVPANVIA